MSNTSDVRINIRVRNNLILKRMEHRNIRSVAELIRQMGLDSKEQTVLYQLVNMTMAARNERRQWHGLCYRLADFFECEPEDLFSAVQQEVSLEKNASYAELTYVETMRLTSSIQEPTSPELQLQADELREAIRVALSKLTPREERVIRLRFGFDGGEGLTLQEIADQLNVSGSRAQQIEAKALRKIKHPANAKVIFAAAGRKEKVTDWQGREHDRDTIDDDILKAL